MKLPKAKPSTHIDCTLLTVALFAAIVLSTTPGCNRNVKPQSVVLIVVDTLRADHLGAYDYQRRTTPELDRWVHKGVVFDQVLATSPWTLPTFGSMLTGHLLSRHSAGIRIDKADDNFVKLSASLPTLAERFRNAGFSTGAIVNNPFLGPDFGMDRGFESYNYQFSTNWRHRRAGKVVKLALDWIDSKAGQPFFLLIHIFDPHMAYDAPEPIRGRFTAEYGERFELPVENLGDLRTRAKSVSREERDFVAAAYDEEIAFVDLHLGRFFKGLENRDIWKKLLILFTSDHGEEIFEHGGFEHGHTVYQEVLRLPLLVWSPGIKPRRESVPVSVIDLTPTILDAVGIEFSEQEFFGRSLWANIQEGHPLLNRPLIAEGTRLGPERKAIVQWPFKLELEPEGNEHRLYDLVADPGEKVDLSLSEVEKANELREALLGTLAAASEGADGEVAPLSPELLEKLRSLGYVK